MAKPKAVKRTVQAAPAPRPPGILDITALHIFTDGMMTIYANNAAGATETFILSGPWRWHSVIYPPVRKGDKPPQELFLEK